MSPSPTPVPGGRTFFLEFEGTLCARDDRFSFCRWHRQGGGFSQEERPLSGHSCREGVVVTVLCDSLFWETSLVGFMMAA